eukprot:663923_1
MSMEIVQRQAFISYISVSITRNRNILSRYCGAHVGSLVLEEMTRVAKIYPYLNPSQLRAIVLAMYEELVIIQGPPGTGKTHTAIHMIRCILQNHTSPSHYRIVIAAQTNAACNQLLYEIVHQDETLAANTVRFANP